MRFYTGVMRHITTRAAVVVAVLTTAGLSRVVWSPVLFLLCRSVRADSAFAQVYKLADMNTRQIQALDRERTVLLIPGGILRHGKEGFTVHAGADEQKSRELQ